MPNPKHYAVILAGGRGERFWPMSTSRHPKQLLALAGGKPLLVQAVERLRGLVPPDRIFIITNRDFVPAMRRAVRLPKRNIVGEPIGRDTAAAIAAGAALVKARDPRAVFCVLTADHVIGDLGLFRRTLRACLERAERDDVLITVGIRPTEPSTGFGYIETKGPGKSGQGVRFLPARRFVEKPDLTKATRYCASGRFFWNSGMFVWSVRAFETALTRHRPSLATLMRRLRRAAGTDRFAATLEREYRGIEKISIDYALMEKARNILMAVGEFAWDDVGSWPALDRHLPRDASGNVAVGRVEALDSFDNVIVSKDRLTALLGVSGLVVVHAGFVTMICPRDRAQDVKKLVEKVKADGRYGKVL
jgi:mannose-1-phosphate guanylyltransferase